MLKIIGALMILITGILIGFYQAAQYANRPKHIRQMIQAMQRLETEINYGFTPLTEALDRISKAIPEPAAGIYRQAAEQLHLNDGRSTKDLWKSVIVGNWDTTSMNSSEMDIMLQLGTTLGISDRKDQIKHIQLAANQMQGEEAAALDEQKRYEKMWKSLGALSGILIVILMY